MNLSKQILVRSVILAIGLYSADSSATVYLFRKLIPGAKQSCHLEKVSGPVSFTYTGSVQPVTVPTGASYAVADVIGGSGAGGMAGVGGASDALSGRVPVSPGETLEVLVGQGGMIWGGSYGGDGGGGGLSGIFSGTPSQATALLVAGGWRRRCRLVSGWFTGKRYQRRVPPRG